MHFLERFLPKWPARRCQDQALHHVFVVEHLEYRIMFGIDRQNGGSAGGGGLREQGASANDAFFIGERQDRAAPHRRQSCRQTRRADNCAHDPVRRAIGRLYHGLRAGGDVDARTGQAGFQLGKALGFSGYRQLRAKFEGLLNQPIDIARTNQRADGKGVSFVAARGAHNVQGRTTD